MKNISRRPCTWKIKVDETICASEDYWKMKMKHRLKRKRKLRMSSSKNSILNLLQKLNVLIAQIVPGGMMELQNRERSFASLLVIKQRRQFTKRQGKQLPQLKQAKAQGKLAYFSLDKLIIRDRPNGSTHGLNV